MSESQEHSPPNNFRVSSIPSPNLWQSLQNNQDLSILLGTPARTLTWLATSTSEHYSFSKIRKKNGTFRKIYNPDAHIRSAQAHILAKILEQAPIEPYVYAFEKRKSIPVMTQVHVGKRLVISLDIKDFFTAITQAKIQPCLQALGMGQAAARTVSELCTYTFFVPQGGLTSPKIANLITSMTFGPDVNRLCQEEGFDLTIYADDITLSTNREGVNIPGIISRITGHLQTYGFRVNKAKTKVMPRAGRQYVCGVVVNEKNNMLLRSRQKLRAIIHYVEKEGIEAAAQRNGAESAESFESMLKGRVNWLKQLNQELGTKLKARLDRALEGTRVERLLTGMTAHYADVG